MPSANISPITELMFDGAELQRTDGSVLLEIKRGLDAVPSVRGTDQVVPGRPGRIARSRVAEVLAIELEGTLEGVGADAVAMGAAFAALRQEIRALFDPTKDPAVLSCVLEDGSTATINARPIPPLLWEQLPGFAARLNIALESVDPDWVIAP